MTVYGKMDRPQRNLKQKNAKSKGEMKADFPKTKEDAKRRSHSIFWLTAIANQEFR